MKAARTLIQKKIIPAILTVAVLVIIGFGAEKVIQFKSRFLSGFAEHEILIMFKPETTFKEKMSLIVRIAGQEYQELSFKNLTRVLLEPDRTFEEAMDICKKEKSVVYAQRNYIYTAQALPDDPDFSHQWPEAAAPAETSGDDASEEFPPVTSDDFDLSWDIVHDCSTIITAVIDTGINYTHQDLASNMWDGSGKGIAAHGYDFVDEDDDPMDLNGHGTVMAGIIGAAGNNGTGIAGLCWEAALMAVRVLDETGRGTTSDIVQGIAFAAENGASIMTLGFGSEIPFDRAMSDALDLARESDIVAVAAAGNGNYDGKGMNNDSGGKDGDTVTSFYPCSFKHDNLICAAALDRADSLAPFSNYGKKTVDIAAPGQELLSTKAGFKEVISDDLESGWVLNGGWDSEILDLGFGTFPVLVNPEDWDKGGYEPGTDDRAYKSFTLSSYDSAVLSFYAFVNTQIDQDFFRVVLSSGGRDPFTEGIELDLMSGETGNNAYLFSYALTENIAAANTIGFQLMTDEEQDNTGIGIFRFELSGLKLDPGAYGPMEGTSMAAAYISGIAALVRSQNIDYSARDTIKSLLHGGCENSILSDKTATGKDADVYGSLLFINKPEGLTVKVEE